MKSVMLAAAACVGLAAPAMGQNLLTNGSFETTISPLLGGGFENWFRFNNMFADESVEVMALDGLVSVKSFGEFLGVPSQSDSGLIQDAPVADAAGKTYRLSLSVQSLSTDRLQAADFSMATNRGSLPLLIMDFKSSSGQVLQSQSAGVWAAANPSDTWIDIEVQGVAPAGTALITAFLLHIQFDNATGSLFWDNAVLEEVAVSCPADFNGDTVPGDIFDLFDFLAALDGGLDFNGDTSPADIFDLFDFLSVLDQGCP